MATPPLDYYDDLQRRLIEARLLPSVLKNAFEVCDVHHSSGPGDLKKTFPNLFGQPSAILVPSSETENEGKSLQVGVVLSGDPAPGEHNVFLGINDYLKDHCQGSKLYRLMAAANYVELNSVDFKSFINQVGSCGEDKDKIETFEQLERAVESAKDLDLDGLVVIGDGESNTNACLLAENFRREKLKTQVIGCPKTIDGDLKCKEVPISFGFDTACKLYAEKIGKVMVEACSTGKYYYFVQLMGRSASHITLECALQTHPNITLIGEEVASNKQTLKSVSDSIANIIAKRTESGYNYGVILIPEGLSDFFITENSADEAGVRNTKPAAIQEKLIHGNVQVAKIDTVRKLIEMVEFELEQRKKAGSYNGQFEGKQCIVRKERLCLPSSFDATYCYTLGYAAGALLQSGKTGLISSVGNLSAPAEMWSVGGTSLTSLMDVEGKEDNPKPVIKKAMVELKGALFKKFDSLRGEWEKVPGPSEFVGLFDDQINYTLLLDAETEKEKDIDTLIANAIDSLKSVIFFDGSLLTMPLLEFCMSIIPVIDSMDGIFKLLAADIEGNAKRIGQKYWSDKTKFSNLRDIVKDEYDKFVEGKAINGDIKHPLKVRTSCTLGLLWMTRDMEFLVEYFKGLSKKGKDDDLTEDRAEKAYRSAYDAKLGKWHGGIAQSVYKCVDKIMVSACSTIVTTKLIGGFGVLDKTFTALFANICEIMDDYRGDESLKNVRAG